MAGRASKAISSYGLDAICRDIADRKTLTAISEDLGVSVGSLLTWIESDSERSARVREARAATASLWDEQAEVEIRAASDPLQLAKARELAFHYRWRATKIAPREYGDKVEVAARMTLEQLVGSSLKPSE